MNFEVMCREQIRLRLEETDELVKITDHGKRTEILAYRQLLRDYPATEDFPSIDDLPQINW
jgi:hypothetical protein|tara:strand:+ start:1636 stop:1818 length:183 start_codon:yes stop_codon:yes gene_type:complete